MDAARDLFSYRKYWASRLTPAPDRGKPLPPSPRGIMTLDDLMRQLEADREDR